MSKRLIGINPVLNTNPDSLKSLIMRPCKNLQRRMRTDSTDLDIALLILLKRAMNPGHRYHSHKQIIALILY